MMTLEDIRPTERENEATADMPEQVAIGWIRAKRKHDLRQVRKPDIRDIGMSPGGPEMFQ